MSCLFDTLSYYFAPQHAVGCFSLSGCLVSYGVFLLFMQKRAMLPAKFFIVHNIAWEFL